MIVTERHFELKKPEWANDEATSSAMAGLGISPEPQNIWDEMDVGTHCFVCHQKLTLPSVMWHGTNSYTNDGALMIWLHPDCAVRLGGALLVDGQGARGMQ